MPPRQEKDKQQAKKVDTQPSQGFLQRLFGTSQMSPEIEEGIRIARAENPNLANVEMYGPLSRLLLPNALGYTSPGQTIYMNPRMNQGQSPQDIADTILHEQTHVGQMRQRGLGMLGEFMAGFGDREPYHQRPDEIEAFQAEMARRNKMGRLQTGVPEFTTGRPIAPQNIYLPPEKGIKVGPSRMR